jgi:tRNA threonylcarbamoyladenosine biosynthesis protein TsaB
MDKGENVAAESTRSAMLLLGIDTCGPSGSVALGWLGAGKAPSLAERELEILGEIELEGRSYSSTLITAVSDLLNSAGVSLKDVGAIVAVHGPGSFTGVRVGLSAVKGLAEPLRIPVAVVSRLAVLAAKAGADTAALDAHRGEVFLRIDGRAASTNESGPNAAGAQSTSPTELLAGTAELNMIDPAPAKVAVCDDAAASLLASAWPSAELLRVAPPTATDALRLAAPRVTAGAFVDLASLDGNYLRRSDAEIFGKTAEAQRG